MELFIAYFSETIIETQKVICPRRALNAEQGFALFSVEFDYWSDRDAGNANTCLKFRVKSQLPFVEFNREVDPIWKVIDIPVCCLNGKRCASLPTTEVVVQHRTDRPDLLSERPHGPQGKNGGQNKSSEFHKHKVQH